MENVLDYLFRGLVLLSFVVGGIGVYHQLALFSVWRRERAQGRGRWDPLLIFSNRMPEIARPQRNRYAWSIVAFLAVLALVFLIHPLAYPRLYQH